MKRAYETPALEISKFENADIITTSGLTFGGENGNSQKESFNTLFK